MHSRAARAAASRLTSLRATRGYNFASSQYSEAFSRNGWPDAGAAFTSKLRADTVAYMESYDLSVWSSEPMTTLLEGEPLTGGSRVPTVDAFGNENGAAIEATPAQVDAVLKHMLEYKPPKQDYRAEVRAMEAEILDVGSKWPAMLVGNQAFDFRKQDGITEIEESVEANTVERRLNDQLLADEATGKLAIDRAPAYVACVSNFSNFLDLCRKGLRNLEVGVPIVVLSRSNTTQHVFRWSEMLVELCAKHGIDAGMVTFLSAPTHEQGRLFGAASRSSPLYFTGSREVARVLRGLHGPVMASTGGPNTLVATRCTESIAGAIRLSASIENSGQCTALRHAVLNCSDADVEAMLGGVPLVTDSADALRRGEFAGVFADAASVMRRADGYTYHPENANVAYRRSDALPPPDLAEQWRNVYVDVTSPGVDVRAPAFVAELSRWLVAHQPITVAVNAEEGEHLALGRALWEQTGQVVFTVGTLEQPALTCQARPQDGEIFGEFPPRSELLAHTKFPVLVPTPTPAYNAAYAEAHLARRGASWEGGAAAARGVRSDVVRGYLRELHDYLADACARNPKRGEGVARTSLYGLQTTPRNGQLNYVRCGGATSLDEIAPQLMPFVLTNAADALRVSVDPANSALAAELQTAGVAVVAEDDAAFAARVGAETPYNVLSPGAADGFPLVGQFVSTLLCVGHVKSTKPADDDFIDAFKGSPKWLAMAQ